MRTKAVWTARVGRAARQEGRTIVLPTTLERDGRVVEVRIPVSHLPRVLNGLNKARTRIEGTE